MQTTNEQAKASPSGSLEGCYETWLNRYYRINTIRGLLGILDRFTQWCETENIKAEQCSYTELIEYIKYCTNKGLAKRTINLNITALKKWFDYLTEINQREDNPTAELRIKNQMHKVVHDVIPYQDIENIYKQYPAKGIIGKRNKAVLSLIIYQGVNTGELKALEVNDLKLEEGKIYIPATGRSNSRTLKLEAQQIVQLQNYVLHVRPVLMAMIEQATDKLFFSTGSRRNIGNSFVKMLRIIHRINPSVKNQQHIRKSVIVHWYKHHNARQVQYMAGHRYVSSTEKYRTDKLESLQEQLEKIHPIR